VSAVIKRDRVNIISQMDADALCEAGVEGCQRHWALDQSQSACGAIICAIWPAF